MAEYRGVVELGGSSYPAEVSGSPNGSITVRVGGQTVFDKKPFIAKESYDLIIHGKSATLTWLQAGILDVDCEIAVEGKRVVLAKFERSGRVRPALNEAAREKVLVRNYGLGCAIGGLAFILLNYEELTRNGHYYPKWLFVAPILIVFGLYLAVAKPTSKEPPTQKMWWGIALVFLVMCGVGWAFSRWFLLTFGR